MKRLAIVCVLVMLSSVAFAHKKNQPDVPAPVAKSGPSFDATRDWITSTLEAYGGDDENTLWHTVTDVNVSNSCVLTFTVNQFQDDWKNGRIPFPYDSGRITVPMGGVSVAEVNYNDNSQAISFRSLTNASIIGDTIQGNTAPAYASYDINVGRQPQAVLGQSAETNIPVRLANALQHMADICAGTYQAPVATKEPF